MTDAQGKLGVGELESLVAGYDDLPALPAVMERLVSLLEQAPIDRTALARAIGGDAAVALRVIARAGEMAGAPCRTIPQAVDALEDDVLAATILSMPVAAETPGKGEFDRAAFARHCLAVAIASRRLCEAKGLPIECDEAELAGLLHDLGKLALACKLPKSYQRVLDAVRSGHGNIAEKERLVLGVDHTAVGYRCAQQWALSPVLAAAAWLHHQDMQTIPPSVGDAPLIAAVTLADTVARQSHIGFSGNFVFTPGALQQTEQLGIPAADVERIAGELSEQVQRRGSELGLDRPLASPQHDALCRRMHALLGRLAQRLSRTCHDLHPPRQAMRLLSQLGQACDGRLGLPQILLRVATLTASAVQVRADQLPVAAYSVLSHGEQILAALSHDAPGGTWRSFHRKADWQPASPGSSFMPAAGIMAQLADDREWADWIHLPQYVHQPIICGQRWVGGVLLPAEVLQGPDAPQRRHLLEALIGAMGIAVELAQQQDRSERLSEQLAAASQVLAATQEALAEAKMHSSVAEMAAGAAHELNNPLAIISGRAQLMCDRAAGDDQRKVWQLIADQAHRISDIITALMNYASPPASKPQRQPVRQLVEEGWKAYAASSLPGAGTATVEFDITDDLPNLWADRSQILLVLTEVFVNAAHAVGEGLRLRVGAHRDEATGQLLLTVADNGPGMDEPTLQAAFTPFFSRQRAGRRRGLGLSTARRYVENNDGRMWLRSHVGQGTTVFIELPAADVP